MATSTAKKGSKSATKAETKSAGSKRAAAAKPSKATSATSASGSAKRTTNHEQIQKWAEQRKGRPAMVKQTGDGKAPGILRIDFPGYSGKYTLETIGWDEFFSKFDESNLEFLYQEKTAGGKESRFNKFVSKES